MTPRCSVVIITWNRRRELERALDSLFRQTIARELDIIVIDNGSNDGTVEWLRGHQENSLRLFVFDRNHGASHGRNAGIRLARAEHVCFLDSDAEILTDDAIEPVQSVPAPSTLALVAGCGMIGLRRRR